MNTCRQSTDVETEEEKRKMKYEKKKKKKKRCDRDRGRRKKLQSIETRYTGENKERNKKDKGGNVEDMRQKGGKKEDKHGN